LRPPDGGSIASYSSAGGGARIISPSSDSTPAPVEDDDGGARPATTAGGNAAFDEKTRFAASAMRESVEWSNFDAISSRCCDAIIILDIILMEATLLPCFPSGMFEKINLFFFVVSGVKLFFMALGEVHRR
jgi:hypothetical protein